MTFTASPTLTIGGAAVPIAAAGGVPPLVALDDLRVPWGRSSVLDTPTSATCEVSLLDTARGYPFASRTDLLGQLVVVGWSGSDGSTGVIFRGRITDSDAAPVTYRDAAGRAARAYRVALAASSVEVDLSQHKLAEGSAVWPAETLEARADRLVGYIAGRSYVGGLRYPDRFGIGTRDPAPAELDSILAAEVDPSGQDVLALLRAFYTTLSPLPMQYDPRTDAISYAPRVRYVFGGRPGDLMGNTWAITPTAKLIPSPDGAGILGASLDGLHLDAGRLGYGGAAAQHLEGRVTRVTVSYTDITTAEQAESSVTTWAGTDSTMGTRVLAVTAGATNATDAAQLAGWYADVCNYEARVLSLRSLEFSTAREPFPDVAHARALLAACETGSPIFLGRSWLTDLGIRPLFTVLGGTIGYTAGQWTVAFVPAPVIVDPYPKGWGPLTVAAVDPAGTLTLGGLHDSLTVGDVGWLDVGAGQNATTQTPYPGNPI